MLRPFTALLCVLALAVAGWAQDLVKWDFETGDLQGWKAVSGDVGKQPTDKDDDRYGGNFGKQGKWFIGTYENSGDEPKGELRSPVFTIQADKMALLVGGGGHIDSTFVALVLLEGDKEIARACGEMAEAMREVLWNTSAHKGQKAYVRVVDLNSGGWGHVNVDYVREVSAEEIARMAREERERKERAEKRYAEWKQTIHAPTQKTVYKGEAQKACIMHLSGAGTGSVALCGDGALRQWQINNHVCSRAYVPYGFLAVSAQAEGDERVSRVLQTEKVDALPCVDETEFVGEWPIAELACKDAALPVEVSVEAFSPFIPLRAKDSGIPAVMFILHLSNPGQTPAQVGAMMSVQNLVGWDGSSVIDGLRNAGYGGNANEVVRGAEGVTLVARNGALDKADKNWGTVALSCPEREATAVAQWDDSAAMWEDFSADGEFDEAGVAGASEKGQTHNGAVACRMTLMPGQSVELPFILSWHFPNRYAEYDGNLAKYRLGNMYNNWFADAQAVAESVTRRYADLRDGTRLFRETLYDSNLPYWLTDAVSSQISTITSQTCLWVEDGSFHGFEGCGGDVGCCPMNCTHVWNYEQSMAHIQPELERNVRHTDLWVQQDQSGFVHHRTALPLSLPRGSGPFADGHLSTISKAYREHLMSADNSWLRENWPRIRAAMDWAMGAYDPDGNGVIEVEQWNTYDCSVWGPNTFIGSQWLAALRAAEEMAKQMREPATAAKYRAAFEKGAAKMDKDLWNGEWWIQDVDLEKYPRYQYGTGCHSDQLLGQWWANQNDLGPLFPKAHVDTALRSIFEHNFKKSFEGIQQTPRVFVAQDDMGLLICTWPKGGRPEVVTLYCDEVWTGIEYAVAGLMLQEGLVDEAYQVTKAARDRYDGRVKPSKGGYNGAMRSPWNEIECGEHYARAMASYSLLTAAEGYAYDGPAGVLKFAPEVQPENLRGFFTVAEGWGTLSQRREGQVQTDEVALAFGRLRLNRLEVQLPAGAGLAKVEVRRGDEALRVRVVREGQSVTVVFPSGVLLSAGQSLKVTVGW